jgi:hypothetical protein
METIYLVANGDLRLSANQNCWPAQQEMEKQLTAAMERKGARVQRAHPYDPVKKHGFIDSQKYGIQVFHDIPTEAPLVVAEAVWEYSQHILPGLMTHRGPIMTVANWSGTWPGLVGLLNLNACMTKAGIKYSSLWSEDFTDDFFTQGLKTWLKRGRVKHDTSHVHPVEEVTIPSDAKKLGRQFADEFREQQAIMGVFDESCMGMYNAVIPDELLNPTGVFKERMSQSALYARMRTVSDEEARDVFDWLVERGMHFDFGTNEATDLTENQVLPQCKMYIAAMRMADEFGCATIGIQYQQGLKDLVPASDLVEGLLNNTDRPPVKAEDGRELYPNEALPHFNEVDECAGLDALVTHKLWQRLDFAPETTLHDLRWGRQFKGDGIDDFVWVLEISGAVPPAHFATGYREAIGERQPPMYFPLGGSTIKGASKPGWVVWSRVFIKNDKLNYDIGLGEALKLPEPEVQERWRDTTPQWPVMNLVLQGITRDQMMARHKSNHIQVVYGPDRENARRALFAKATAMKELGLNVSICGDV